MKERLQKILARAGVGSRRKAEQYIKEGRVSIDDKVVTEMGIKVDPRRHRIQINGRPLEAGEKKLYILLNKPKGYVTTLHDPQGRPIVTALLKGISERVFPVGRLDLDTEGALLLTNDGDLAQRVLHPSHEVTKTYIAKVAGNPSPEKLKMLAGGIDLDGRRTAPAELKMIKKGAGFTLVRIIIHEGRKRQVRKMFAAVGHRVLELRRIAYGNLKLGSLPPGKYRLLSRQDVARIFSSR